MCSWFSVLLWRRLQTVTSPDRVDIDFVNQDWCCFAQTFVIQDRIEMDLVTLTQLQDITQPKEFIPLHTYNLMAAARKKARIRILLLLHNTWCNNRTGRSQ